MDMSSHTCSRSSGATISTEDFVVPLQLSCFSEGRQPPYLPLPLPLCSFIRSAWAYLLHYLCPSQQDFESNAVHNADLVTCHGMFHHLKNLVVLRHSEVVYAQASRTALEGVVLRGAPGLLQQEPETPLRRPRPFQRPLVERHHCAVAHRLAPLAEPVAFEAPHRNDSTIAGAGLLPGKDGHSIDRDHRLLRPKIEVEGRLLRQRIPEAVSRRRSFGAQPPSTGRKSRAGHSSCSGVELISDARQPPPLLDQMA